MTHFVCVTQTTTGSWLSGISLWSLFRLSEVWKQKRETCSLPSGSLLSSSRVSLMVSLKDTLKCNAQFPVPAITRENGRFFQEGDGLEQGLEACEGLSRD